MVIYLLIYSFRDNMVMKSLTVTISSWNQAMVCQMHQLICLTGGHLRIQAINIQEPIEIPIIFICQTGILRMVHMCELKLSQSHTTFLPDG